MEDQIAQKIEEKIKGVDRLPTLPVVYSRLTKLVNDPKTTASDVSAVIEKDQALTARILKVVNSAFYGFPHKITTISHSVVILGFNEIRNIAFSASIIKMFGEKQNQVFDQKKFWCHSLGVAICTRILAQRSKIASKVNMEEAFICGLIHDIGKLVEDQFMNDDFILALSHAKQKLLPLVKAEQVTLGFTHQDVGFFLSQKWQLPPAMCDVVKYHNRPLRLKEDHPSYPIVCLVHIANSLARAIDIGSGGDPFVPNIEKDCWKLLGLSKSYLEIVLEEAYEGYQELNSLGLLD